MTGDLQRAISSKTQAKPPGRVIPWGSSSKTLTNLEPTVQLLQRPTPLQQARPTTQQPCPTSRQPRQTQQARPTPQQPQVPHEQQNPGPQLPPCPVPQPHSYHQQQTMAMLKEVLSGMTNINRKITTLEKRMASLEGKTDLMVEQQNLRQQIAPAAEISEDEIPIVFADVAIDEEILHGMRCQVNSAGNFRKLLSERMFPELFGPTTFG
ncbi:gamma-gliadin B-like [Pecten maximus]|uniref:gamma-gliadin B-like n=1 Tax=Pecten maximus TaxID=6579 RepID=UPI0014583A5C|nr:gamma-gliadin B-like [Pecten maximus]